MAKGAKKKTKWVSLSLDGANTTTSSGGPGSDSEQHHHHGSRNKSYHHGNTSTLKHGSKESPLSGGGDGAVSLPGSLNTATATEQEQSGHRTDTSGDSANGSGSERRQSAPYHKRRPQSYYSDRRSWNYSSFSNGGRNHYGYYGAANRRSYYDSHGRRAAPQHAGRPEDDGTASKTTTANEGGGTNTINDDEYTRITTPRQDVLFKKGYLSRPKPTTGTTTASTSNENTASSSIAGTTGSSSSEGSDGGNGGGSNSISTTESITSDYGGSFAAADSYPIPCLPYGYFTENGVLVMNGFAVDNNGYSYFNGGQTYIYPPNFSNCPQQQQSVVADAEVPGVIYTDDGTIVAEPIDGLAIASCSDGSEVPGSVIPREDATPAMNSVEAPDSETAVPDGFMVPVCTDPVAPADGGTLTGTPGDEALELEEGCYQFGDTTYDMAQFCSSLYYQPPWFMGHYGMYDDGTPTAAPEYLLPNGEVYTHQTGFRKRKKRFRNIDEVRTSGWDPGRKRYLHRYRRCAGTALGEFESKFEPEIETNLSNLGTSFPQYGNATFECNLVPTEQPYQLNADVQEFLPTVPMPAPDPIPTPVTPVEAEQTLPRSARKDTAQKSSKNASTVAKQSKTAAKSHAILSETNSATVSAVSVRAENRASAAAQKNRKKDLIESTRAFAEQNIDLTRPKLATGSGGGATNDSETFWTTVRKGGKKRVEQSSPEPRVTDVNHRKSPALEQSVTKQSSPVATVALVPVDVPPVAAPPPPPVATESVARTAKSKKKTQKHKRQHRKPGGTSGYHRQPLEGFQLIEPEFPSATAPMHRARGCIESEPTDHRDEAEDDDERHDDDLMTAGENDDPEVSTKWPVVEVVAGDELICDMTVQEDVPHEPEPEPLEPIVHERHRECSEAPVAASTLHETETEQERSTELLDNIAIPVVDDGKDGPSTESTAKAIAGVMLEQREQEQEVLQENINTPTGDGAVAEPLLTIAAKQPRSPATSDKDEDDEEDDRVERRDLAAGKRDSVSGGYTESIDSGLQSPAPCGLASPEASSLVSSLESEPPGTTGSQEPLRTVEPQQPLSQLVGRWLSRKLEVHDPDEVFVLPHSNPLLMERLQRFQQLQCGRNRLTSDAYESEGVDDEADDDDDDGDRSPDTDSDYMSDGQGRLDAGDGSTGTSNPNSPTNLPVFAGTEHEDNGGHKLNLHLNLTTSGVLNGGADRTIEPECRKESKRCLIM
ncbi:uncharacterized protein LOC131215058 [Anopheles bellator]|uniref:uncharacterized protein LOC131215058 n=1 Tax=Anopheles bellator TaxID=139047 RepID=UPI0026497F16|nr:uncharacterized protein LOC131215058 [Anopheles bellator]